MIRIPFRLSIALAAPGLAAAAGAIPPAAPWFVQVGVARVASDAATKVRVLGLPAPGAGARLAPRYTAGIELGRFVTAHVAVSLSAGLPLKQPISAAGTIQAYGRLGRVTYGPAAATLQWHLLPAGKVRPYVGGGLSYMHIFADRDGAVRDFRLSDDIGPVVQAGLSVPLGHGFGLFVDAKKGWLRTTATGVLAGAPVSARIRIDPLILHAGLAFRA